MSDTGFGDAVPVYRAGESSNKKTAGEKTNGEIDKTMTQRLAEMRDAAEITTRCAIDGCTWTHTGPAGAARQVALDHRQDAHPHIEKGVRRCSTPGCTGRAVKGLDVCGGCRASTRRERATASAMRARGLNRDGTPLLEEVASTGDVGAASSSSTLDNLAAAQPEPPAAAATTTVADPATTAPTGEQPSGQAAASTTHIQEVDMENRYGLARAGRGFKWTKDAAIQAVRDFHEAVGRTPQQQDSRDEPTGTLPSEAAAKAMFGGWDELITTAGFEPVDRRQQRARGVPTAKTPPPQPAVREAPPVPQPLTPPIAGTSVVQEPVMAEQSIAVLAAELEQASVDLAAARDRYDTARAALANHPTIAQLQETKAA